MKQTQNDFLHLVNSLQGNNSGTPSLLSQLDLTNRKRTTHHLRDGEVVLYLRPTSRIWQVRYKLFDRKWRCVSTKQRQLDWAKRVAGELYDKARFREEEGLPQKSVRFGTLANECIRVLKVEIERGIRPNTNMDYIRAMNNYLIPFFGKMMLTSITAQKVAEYESWRNQKMGKVPISSTLANHSSAFNRVIDLAIEQGAISDKVIIPKLSRKGKKGSPRPAFTQDELKHLLEYMPKWCLLAERKNHVEMRQLLRDYVELLLTTGMRSGRESMNMLWKHIEWYNDGKTDVRYLRIWVSGKTGGRWLIAKHRAASALERLAIRQGVGANLNEAIAAKSDAYVFSLSAGQRPTSMHTSFELLMKDSGMRVDAITGKNRSLYSLRHCYATMSLMDGQMDMHTLAKQMGTSVGMLEQHYSKMTATMAAERLA